MKTGYSTNDHTFAICAYGESPYLDQCVQSLFDQDKASRVVIFTSTPNDHIAGIAEKYDLPLVTNEDARGIVSDWNYAYEHTETKLVTLVHQDDLYYPDFLEQTLKQISLSNEPLIAFTAYHELQGDEIVTEKDFINLRIKRILLAPLNNRKKRGKKWIRRRILSLGNPICCPSVTFVKSNMPERIFDEGLKTNMDWAAWEKLSCREGDFIYIPKALMAHRIYEGSVTGKLIKNGIRSEEDLKVLQRFWPEPIAKAINRIYSKSQKSRLES